MEKNNQVKIAIVTHQMVMGGIEKSLIELCKALVQRGVEVTLYLEAMGGELFDELPDEVAVVSIFEEYGSLATIIKKSVIKGDFRAIISAMRARKINRRGEDPVEGWKAVCGYLQKNEIKYDYAFAYGAPVAFSTIYVDRMINAKRKYTWIHNDPTRLSLDIRKYRALFQPYEKIVCVSVETLNTFLSIFPEYKDKGYVFYNIIDRDELHRKAMERIDSDAFLGTRLLTVGRLCSPKGQDLIPQITRRLLDNGYNIRWYCVGEGENREKIADLIHKYHVESAVVLLGNKNNPYPYFKMADIYIQPSRHEGFGITLTEAKVFELPIITTDFGGASEQITHGETGVIVRFDEDEIYRAIVRLLENDEKMTKLKENLGCDKKCCISSIDNLLQ